MCLALFALAAHPRYALVVAANRDEYHARPAARAAWWDDGWLAGRDLKAGGTWFGVARTARWAFVTNVREPSRHDPGAPSRGSLVPTVLAHAEPPTKSLERIVAGAVAQNGFNLVAGLGAQAAWASNRAVAAQALPPGIHGVSNAALDTPWPKVTRTKALVAAWCAAAETDIAPLFAMLADRRVASDAELPSTGVTLERERLLSAPFIVSPAYGTRCSTVLTVDRDGAVRFVERSFDSAGAPAGDVEYRFTVA
ncbi:MAG TPA: NRDE family protein [Casimicrobiaceae bacterium]|nr:NRDE family protein [Casimicrobiaceae bacterium]